MDISGRRVVVTGAASGIGAALARCFSAAGAQVVCCDRDRDGVQAVAKGIAGAAFVVDVSREDDLAQMIDTVENDLGPIDIFCSNAGVLFEGGPEAANADWQMSWDVNVMSHVWAARHMVPRMIERGGGYFLNTASAAGLLSQIGSASYAATKHAAVGFAEWLSFTYGDRNIGVSVLCPQAVRTKMLEGFEGGVASIDGIVEPDDVARMCLHAVEAETFLVLPHPEVAAYFRVKAENHDRWLRGMRKLNRRFDGGVGDAS